MSTKELLKEQEQIGLKIDSIVTNTKKDGPSRRTASYIEDRKKLLCDLYEQACKNHDTLKKDSSIADHQYFTTRYYQQIKISYEEAMQYFEKLEQGMKSELHEKREPQNNEIQKQKYRIQQLSKRIQQITQAMMNNEAEWQIESMVQAAQRQWDLVEEADVNISIYGSSSNDSYYIENLFEEIQIKFENMKKEANRIINGYDNQLNVKSSITLPKITIPMFHGNYETWPSFRDLFEKIIHQNRTISDAEKMQYLKTHVKGEAERLIQHLNVTDSNYEAAWDLLQKRYQNERLIINKFLDRILDIPRMDRPMVQDLKNLYNTVNESLVALKNLGMEVDAWGPILTRIITRKWDKSTNHLNELSLDNPHKRQEFAEIMKFMDKRIKSLEITSVQDNQRMTGQQNYTKIKGTPGHDKKRFNKTKACAMCNGINHAIMNCTMFKMLDLNARIRIVDERRICHCCLSHDSRIPCQSTKNCEICNKKHHTLLHRWGVHSETTKKESNVDQKTRNKRNVRTYNSQASKSGQISALLPTAIIQIKSSSGEPQLFRALCDQGSEVSFCTEEVAQILGYPKHKISAKISGIGNSKAREASSMIIASISRRRPNGYEMQVPLIILPKLTSALPNKNINEFEIKEIREDLADPTYNRKGKIDILLGASEYGQMLLPGLKKLENGAIAQNTQLGWIVSGNINNNIGKPIRLVSMVSRREEENRLSKFWEMEEVNLVANNLNEDDIFCEEFYTKTTRRNKDGSYTVRIPFKKVTSGTEIQLGESRNRAAARLLQLEKRFKKDENLHRQYDNFMEEYLKLDHMEKVPWEKSSLGKYYIPHQPVVKEDSLTTKLRVVFDASSKTSAQRSLNDMMYKGPRLQEDLPSILLRWRKHRICFMADVEKMYRCIKIADCDQVYQRILWRFTNGRNTSNKTSIEEYQLTTVTYGTSAAPYLAVRTLQQLAKDERKKYPEASRVTMEDFYVDDCLSGEDDVTSAKKLQDQLIRMLKSGQFKLRKWSSNAEPLITELPHENQDMELLQLPHDETRKSLGVLWAPCYDHFTFKISVKENGTPTKRFILSEVSKIFDPLGWLGPIILKMKLLIQQLWIKNIGWDSPLDECYTNQWIEFQKQIKSVENINVPRWMGCMKKTKVELHGFCDASEKAYGAVVYSRVKTINGYIVTLLQAKSKVAPIKQKITLPRLELNAALLLARLLKKIKDTLRCDQIDLNMWSDSMITLGWIKGNPGKWNKFVGIRVSEIRNLTVPEKWNYVKSSENPADIISRGSEPNALQENKLWWEGPLWLKKQNIPMKRVIIDTHEEEIRSYHASTEEESNLWDRFSELQRMLRVLTYCRRVFSKNKSNKTLKVVEIQETLHKLLKIIQRREFETEYNALLKGGTVSKKGRIAALDPFIDEEGLIRVGGRLSNSTLTYNQKHPIILPYKHHVTDLLIRDAHKETLHGGNQATLCYIRNKYWILGIKRRIKTVLNKCVKCIRYKGVNTHQKMGQLPTARVTPSHPFSSSGVDYAGPIQVRTTKGRGHKSYKGYIALFVCLATKAIHLELVSDMTTSSFLAAFRRFTARRGHCYHMYSDNGTYFVKAARTLQHEVLEITQKSHLQDIITNIGTQWHFIPTHSPHFGGLWERGVRSMKHHLKRTIGEATLTFEELTTLLCQIESCLNSRPLCKMDESIESMQALTPSHFLIGREAVGIPDPIEQCIIREPTLRWKMIQKIKKEFWKSWTSDYLNQLQQKYKWRSQGPNVNPGDIVLIKDESISPSKWPLAKVVESHPGSDKLTRVVTVQRSNGTKSKRSIHSIVPLEINENTDAAGSKEREQAQCNATYNKRKDRTYNKTNNPLKWLMLASTIMCLLTSVSGNYTLKKLDEGYYVEELGDVRVDRGVFRIDMTYAKEDLNHDWQHVVNIMKEFEDFCNETKKKTTSETQCFKLYQHLQDQGNELKQVRESLLYLHNIRKKRGVLGNIMTSLFGVNDEVYRDISVLQDNQNKLRQAADHQTTFMISAMASVNATKAAIFDKLEKFRVKLNQALGYVNNMNIWYKTIDQNKIGLHVLQAYQMATNVITEINDHYRRVLQVYMHKATIYDAISPVNVTQMIKRANEMMPHRLRIVQKPLIDSKVDENATHILVHGYFSIQDTSTYVVMNVSPVPKKQAEEIFEVADIQDTLMAVDYNSEYYFEISKEEWRACVAQGNQHFICKPKTISSMRINKNCIISELFKQNSTNTCPRVRTRVTKVLWKPLYMANTWMYITSKPNRISIICDGEREEIILEGAGVLQIEQRCYIKTEENILITRRSESVLVKAVFSKKSNFTLTMNNTKSNANIIPNEEVLKDSDNWIRNLIEDQEGIQHELRTSIWKQVEEHKTTISITTIAIICIMTMGCCHLIRKTTCRWRPRIGRRLTIRKNTTNNNSEGAHSQSRGIKSVSAAETARPCVAPPPPPSEAACAGIQLQPLRTIPSSGDSPECS